MSHMDFQFFEDKFRDLKVDRETLPETSSEEEVADLVVERVVVAE